MIEVNQLSKGFRLYRKPSDRLREIIFRRPLHTRFEALQGISFSVPRGQALGLVGQNGAGKSTLLKILSGVMLPDSGSVHVNGRLTGLLELGTGFDPELTGRRNIYTNGLLIGMSADEIEAREPEIIEFAELGRFIDEPLRTYSSGMLMRLGFAVAIHANPACLLVDEALSVGDGHFQQKCMKRIREFSQAGGSIVFVSHDLNAIKQMCDRALVLEGGEIVYDGDTDGAVNTYNRVMARLDDEDPETATDNRQQHEYGTREATLTGARLVSEAGAAKIVASGEAATIEVAVAVHQAVANLSLGFVIRDRFGQDIFGTNTCYLGQALQLERGAHATVVFRLPMNLAPGKYTLTLALHSDENHLDHCYHWIDNYLEFEVAGSQVPLFAGVTWLPTRVDLLSPGDEALTPTTEVCR